MSDEIINRVQKSSLITIDLEDFYPTGQRLVFDISDWLYERIILKEKDFREKIKKHNWSKYSGKYVAINCLTDAIIPSWAFMLITINLEGYAKLVVQGNLDDLENAVFYNVIEKIEISEYENKSVIIKGCSNMPIPDNAYIFLIQKIKPVVKSLMFGEACSTVPLYKKFNN